MKKISSFFSRKEVLIATSVVLIVIMLIGGWLGNVVSTGGGKVSMSEVSFKGSEDNVISAFIFQPQTATAENKAPAVILAYGGTGLKDFMVNTSIELARRGIVAMSVDTNGCGATESSNSLVAVDAMAYLRSQPYVDTENIGIIIQSFGKMFAQEIMFNEPDWYKSVVYFGITPVGSPMTGVLTDEQIYSIKNVLYVFGTAEETAEDPYTINYNASNYFENPLWDTLIFKGEPHDEPCKEHTIYGSIEDGTARMVVSPNVDHAGTTESKKSISAALEWMTLTLGVETNLAPTNTVMQWKKFWVSISFIAMILFVFTSGAAFVKSKSYADYITPVPEYKGLKGVGYWISAVITTLIGPLTWAASWLKWPLVQGFNAQLPFAFANNYASWFLILAGITTVLLVLDYFLLKKNGFTLRDTGLVCSLDDFAKQAGMALFVFLIIYAISNFIYGKFKMPITLSGLAFPIMFRPLDNIRLPYMLNYFLVYLPYYLTLAVLLFGFMRPKNGKLALWKEMLINVAILAVGPIIFLLGYYLPLYTGHGVNPAYTAWQMANGAPIFMTGYFGVIMIYMIPVPIMNAITACVTTYFNRKTGKVWFAAIIMALLFAWMQVSTVNFAGAIAG